MENFQLREGKSVIAYSPLDLRVLFKTPSMNMSRLYHFHNVRLSLIKICVSYLRMGILSALQPLVGDAILATRSDAEVNSTETKCF